jgi:hypothetical protein
MRNIYHIIYLDLFMNLGKGGSPIKTLNWLCNIKKREAGILVTSTSRTNEGIGARIQRTPHVSMAQGAHAPSHMHCKVCSCNITLISLDMTF